MEMNSCHADGDNNFKKLARGKNVATSLSLMSLGIQTMAGLSLNAYNTTLSSDPNYGSQSKVGVRVTLGLLVVSNPMICTRTRE